MTSNDSGPAVMTPPKQFDFTRKWSGTIRAILNDPDVVKALTIGMRLYDDHYQQGDPPWEFGRGPLNGQRARPGCLSWYQPWGRCHYIAPFSWAVGVKLFPHLSWGFITSDSHTVVIGHRNDWMEPEWVLDILHFRDKTAKESLDFAKSHGWKFYRSLSRYAASFCVDPECALQHLSAADSAVRSSSHQLDTAGVSRTA